MYLININLCLIYWDKHLYLHLLWVFFFHITRFCESQSVCRLKCGVFFLRGFQNGYGWLRIFNQNRFEFWWLCRLAMEVTDVERTDHFSLSSSIAIVALIFHRWFTLISLSRCHRHHDGRHIYGTGILLTVTIIYGTLSSPSNQCEMGDMNKSRRYNRDKIYIESCPWSNYLIRKTHVCVLW